ncbi:MAG: alpha/beta hydrolase-fold protein [Pseudoflavonifractor sp.]|nr:alpha/beta hydrolase-fold protein [Pseudoflavonifractor sp.]
MRIEEFDIGTLHICCAIRPDTANVAYMLYPMDMLQDWIADAAEMYGTSIVVITGMDWDNDLTPWPAPGEPKGCPDFEGHAHRFLDTLTGSVIPTVERRYGMADAIVRTLVGVSLSGLFTLWQWPLCDKFRNIATLSGSYWYEDFEQWVFRQSFSDKTGRCYMLLGVDEPHSAVPAFRRVGSCTENIVGYLRRQGVDVTYNTVPGNHFQFAIERLDKAFSNIYKHK